MYFNITEEDRHWSNIKKKKKKKKTSEWPLYAVCYHL